MSFYGADHFDRDAGKSRFACAAPDCDHGASTGHRITFVNKPDEPRKGYCLEHMGSYEHPILRVDGEYPDRPKTSEPVWYA